MPEQILLRLERLRSALVNNELDAILISCPENRVYISGFTGSAGYLFITANTAIIATDFRYYDQVKYESPDFVLYPLKEANTKWFSDIICDLNIKRLGIEGAHVSQLAYNKFIDAAKVSKANVDLLSVTGIVEGLRAVKEMSEIDCIEKAAVLARMAVEHVTVIAKPGITEKCLAWEAEKFLREKSSDPIPFEIIVASGPNSALPHAKPTDRALRKGEPVVIDLGASIRGYCSDTSYTFCLGKEDALYKRIHDIVLGAQLTAIANITSGMTGEQADYLGRTIILEAGYGDCFGHGLGHGIGLAPHEAPRLGPSSCDTLCNGMVFTIEPGIYISGWGGVRIENTFMLDSGRVLIMGNSQC